MTRPVDEMVGMVFKRVEGIDQKLDTHTFNVLAAIDGVRSVGTIAREDHYEIKDLSIVIEQFVDQGVIEPVLTKESLRSRDDFFLDLDRQLGQLMGPVTSILIQDSVSEMGCDVPSFPMSKAHELINQVSRAIPNREQAEVFVRRMNDMLDQVP